MQDIFFKKIEKIVIKKLEICKKHMIEENKKLNIIK